MKKPKKPRKLSPQKEYELRYLADLLFEIVLEDMGRHDTKKGENARRMLELKKLRKDFPSLPLI
jgi:hypothetical protein